MLEEYTIKNELTDEQLGQLLALSQQMWWSKDRTMDEIKIMLKHCIPFTVIEKKTERLVGFARVLTDAVRYAYIYDVMTKEELRGRGIGKLIMNSILTDAKFISVKYFELTCSPEMAGYYEKLGFNISFGKVVAMRKQQTTS